MGKSRLIGEGVRMAQRPGFRVGLGAAEPSESVAELAPLLRALFDGSEPLLDRAGLSSLHAAPEQRYWRLQDLQSLLERAAMDGPLLIFLDDVQWVDSGTVAALRALPPRLASLPIGWVLAMRPDQGAGQLRSAVEYLVDEGAERLVLEPLSEAAVAQVASDVMRAEPDESLAPYGRRGRRQPVPACGAARGSATGGPCPSRFRACDADRRTGFRSESARACESA